MKKIKKWIVGAVILGLITFGYFFFNGNPMGKKESKQLVETYLKENYPEYEFTVDHVSYYPGEGTYIVHFVSKDNSIQGNIDVIDGVIRAEGVELGGDSENSP